MNAAPDSLRVWVWGHTGYPMPSLPLLVGSRQGAPERRGLNVYPSSVSWTLAR